MSFGAPQTQYVPMPPAAPPPPPAFGEREAPKKQTGRTTQFRTFLGMDAVPQQGQLGQKTLLGQ